MKSMWGKWVSICEWVLKFKYSSEYADYTLLKLHKKLIVERLPVTIIIVIGASVIAVRTQPDLTEIAAMVGIIVGRVNLAILIFDLAVFAFVKLGSKTKS